jgi:hypothetical protein
MPSSEIATPKSSKPHIKEVMTDIAMVAESVPGDLKIVGSVRKILEVRDAVSIAGLHPGGRLKWLATVYTHQP